MAERDPDWMRGFGLRSCGSEGRSRMPKPLVRSSAAPGVADDRILRLIGAVRRVSFATCSRNIDEEA